MSAAEHIICLHDRRVIEAALLRDRALHLYELGDLDDFFWEYTTWYALRRGGEICSLALVYTGTELPILLGLSQPGDPHLASLLRGLRTFLPARFYSHLTPGSEQALAPAFTSQSHGLHDKMALLDRSRLASVDVSGTFQLMPADRAEIDRLYAESYPGNWFDPRMLETGCYFGARDNGKLVSIAGIHVYSPEYKVAALGNITTHPSYRGRGYGAKTTARLCMELFKTVDVIGLNVKSDNASAIAAYRRIGFQPTGQYEEFMFEHQ